MQPQADEPLPAIDRPDACWDRIGVHGDRSCVKLREMVHCRNCPVFAAAGQRLFQREMPAQYRDECTRAIAERDATAASDTRSLLIFRIGSEWLALDTQRAVEVVEPRPIHRVPHRSDRLLLGLANIRGELHLCMALGELLGIDARGDDATSGTTTAKQRLLVAEHNQNRWVFPVDEVEGVCRVAVDAVENLPHTVARSPRHYAQAIVSYKQRQVGVLAPQRLFDALERTVR
jgi:chemotaxis-related protein WspD